MHCVDLGESFQTHIYLQKFRFDTAENEPCKVCRIPSYLLLTEVNTPQPSLAPAVQYVMVPVCVGPDPRYASDPGPTRAIAYGAPYEIPTSTTPRGTSLGLGIRGYA